MSNYSAVYQLYLQGYVGSEAGIVSGDGYPKTERLTQALALGVYHRTTAKPPLMRSVDVMVELRRLRDDGEAAKKPRGDVVLIAVDPQNVIAGIKAVRTILTPSMHYRETLEDPAIGLKEAKDIVDSVRGWNHIAAPYLLLRSVGDRAEVAAKVLRDAGCTVEVR